MAFDIRFPIGLLFVAIGAILAGSGWLGDPAAYQGRSLGLNINLIWGAAMALFGAAMLALTGLAGRKR